MYLIHVDSLSSPWYDAVEEESQESMEAHLTFKGDHSADHRPSREVNSPNADEHDTFKYINCTEGPCDDDSDNSNDLFFSPPASVGNCDGESFILCDAAVDLPQRASASLRNVNSSEYAKVEKAKHQLLKPSGKVNLKGDMDLTTRGRFISETSGGDDHHLCQSETNLTPSGCCVSETSGGDVHVLCQSETSLTPRGCCVSEASGENIHALCEGKTNLAPREGRMVETSLEISDLRSPMFDAGRKFGLSLRRMQSPLVMKANETGSRQKYLAFIATGLTGYELVNMVCCFAI